MLGPLLLLLLLLWVLLVGAGVALVVGQLVVQGLVVASAWRREEKKRTIERRERRERRECNAGNAGIFEKKQVPEKWVSFNQSISLYVP